MRERGHDLSIGGKTGRGEAPILTERFKKKERSNEMTVEKNNALKGESGEGNLK